MNLGRLSINQPILAMVLSIVLLIVGAIAYTTLPVSEYPQVVPPTVVITTQYPGASAQTVSDTVAAPIEQEINGVEDMLYLYSQATSNGQLTITVTFKLGTDLDKAQVLVQNRVAIAQPQLPDEVQRNGVVTRKNSPDILMVVFMLSPDDTFDQLYISNYALLQVRDQLLRLDGVGDIQIFGARDYSMRLWLDPDKISTLGLTAAEVVAAIRAQNVQIAGGQIAEPPIGDRAFSPNLTFTGRLKDPKQFEEIVVKAGADGRTVKLRDVARIELGALAYSTNSFLLRKSAVAMLTTQRPGSNALATAKSISNTMEKLKASFPKGLDYNIGYNPTEFIAQSVSELIKTIYEAMALVVIVVLVFLQGWRPAIIPIIAIPVSLVGTFAVMAALGFSINNLTLFGLVLAVGIVVDDAIVVVENVERHLEHGMSRRDAALRTMEEVGSALVSIALVLCAVFVPTAFLGGISGQFFQQFAVTIAVATAISCFCSLTLSPALASLILQPHEDKRPPASWNFIARGWDAFTGVFNRGFDRLSHGYASAADFVIRHSVVMLVVYAGLIGSAGWLLMTTPQGFIPAQDRGYVIKEDKKFVPTELGIAVNDLLVEHFPDVVDVGFTSTMEEELDEIASGERPWVPVISEFYGPLESALAEAEVRVGRIEVARPEPQKIGELCPESGHELVLRESRFGPFIACSGFPKCRYTRPVVVSTGVECPQCGQGELVEKRSRKGKVFYSCSRYPDCDFSLWEKPVPLPCPQCGGVMTVTGRTQRAEGPQRVKCTRCSHIAEWNGQVPAEETYVATGA